MEAQGDPRREGDMKSEFMVKLDPYFSRKLEDFDSYILLYIHVHFTDFFIDELTRGGAWGAQEGRRHEERVHGGIRSVLQQTARRLGQRGLLEPVRHVQFLKRI